MNVEARDEVVLKLLHYFVTEHKYEPFIVNGTHDELWLQNVDKDYQVIRIVKHHVHNQEQYSFDQFKTQRVIRRMQTRTFTFGIKSLTLYLDLGDNIEFKNTNKFKSLFLKSKKDVFKNEELVGYFPNISNHIKYDPKDLNSFMEITQDINRITTEKNQTLDEIFRKKEPTMTYILMAINIIIYALFVAYASKDTESIYYATVNVSKDLLNHEYYRFLTAAFLHGNVIHLALNMYALYMVGQVVENYYGKVKYLLIYLLSAISSSALSTLFLGKFVSLGASGAIFGLLGAFVYFAYQYRIYFAGIIRNQLVPIIFINLAIGFMPGIDMAGHVGGLIGGLLIAQAVGAPNDDKNRRLNGVIMTSIYFIFLLFLINK